MVDLVGLVGWMLGCLVAWLLGCLAIGQRARARRRRLQASGWGCPVAAARLVGCFLRWSLS